MRLLSLLVSRMWESLTYIMISIFSNFRVWKWLGARDMTTLRSQHVYYPLYYARHAPNVVGFSRDAFKVISTNTPYVGVPRGPR